MHFILTFQFTEEGFRTIDEAPQRAKETRELAEKMGITIKDVYMTSGHDDLLFILETDNDDSVAKFALAFDRGGNVRTRMARAWTQAEYLKLISELPPPIP